MVGLHLDSTLLRTRTVNTILKVLIKCRKTSTDENVNEAIDYILKKRDMELERTILIKRTGEKRKYRKRYLL
jgi:hypothetical protein